MKQIRHAIFETNSSSTHAISISHAPTCNDTLHLDNDGNIVLKGEGEFGWEWESYDDAWTKANYCLIDAMGDHDKLEMLREVIQEFTGARGVFFEPYDSKGELGLGYIDHQSSGTSHTAFASKNQLKRFLFCKESVLVIGNDNSDVPDWAKKYHERYAD